MAEVGDDVSGKAAAATGCEQQQKHVGGGYSGQRTRPNAWLWDRKTSLLGRIYLGLFGARRARQGTGSSACDERVETAWRRSRATESASCSASSEDLEELKERVAAELPSRSGFAPGDAERVKRRQGNYFFTYEEDGGESLLQIATVTMGAMLGRFFMHITNTTTCFDYEKLTKYVFLEPHGVRAEGRGLLTVANHKSVADDPFLLGSLTPWYLPLRTGNIRWGTCASDMCFTNEFLEFAMRALKVLPVVRFRGLDIPEIYHIVDQLKRGKWVNYYPEGRISQQGIDRMRRGVGKIVCLAGRDQGLTVVPMYHEGLEQMLPHTETNQLATMIPRIGKRIWAIVGDPIKVDDLIAKSKTCEGEDCLRIYEDVADRIAVAIRILRSELRRRAIEEYDVYLGDPEVTSDP